MSSSDPLLHFQTRELLDKSPAVWSGVAPSPPLQPKHTLHITEEGYQTDTVMFVVMMKWVEIITFFILTEIQYIESNTKSIDNKGIWQEIKDGGGRVTPSDSHLWPVIWVFGFGGDWMKWTYVRLVTGTTTLCKACDNNCSTLPGNEP